MGTEEQLIRDAAGGDEESLQKLLARCGPVIQRSIRRQIAARWRHILSDDDVMQQTFLDAFLFIKEFEPRGIEAFKTWLTNIARRNLIDAVRELRAAKRGGDRIRLSAQVSATDASFADLFEQIGGSFTSPSQAAMAGEAKIALDQALQEIPERNGLAIRLYDLANGDAEDVAEACDCSVGAMHMRRSRGLAMLRRILRSRSGS